MAEYSHRSTGVTQHWTIPGSTSRGHEAIHGAPALCQEVSLNLSNLKPPKLKPHLLAGVEHLLRDVKDATVSNLSTEIGRMVTGLKGLKSRLSEIQEYLQLVIDGKMPVNHDIMYQLQV